MTNPTNEELLACPFCGGPGATAFTGEAWQAGCFSAACTVNPWKETLEKDYAIECWNTRSLLTSRGDICSVCAGTGKPVSGKPCICKGIGTLHAENLGLREYIFELVPTLEYGNPSIRELLTRLRDRGKSDPHDLFLECANVIERLAGLEINDPIPSPPAVERGDEVGKQWAELYLKTLHELRYFSAPGETSDLDGPKLARQWRERLENLSSPRVADDEHIGVAIALERQRAVKISEAVQSLPIGGQNESMPTPFQSGYLLACEEIVHRLKTEEWVLLDPAAPSPNTVATPPQDLGGVEK